MLDGNKENRKIFYRIAAIYYAINKIFSVCVTISFDSYEKLSYILFISIRLSTEENIIKYFIATLMPILGINVFSNFHCNVIQQILWGAS